jgi:hypothetical protein
MANGVGERFSSQVSYLAGQLIDFRIFNIERQAILNPP